MLKTRQTLYPYLTAILRTSYTPCFRISWSCCLISIDNRGIHFFFFFLPLNAISKGWCLGSSDLLSGLCKHFIQCFRGDMGNTRGRAHNAVHNGCVMTVSQPFQKHSHLHFTDTGVNIKPQFNSCLSFSKKGLFFQRGTFASLNETLCQCVYEALPGVWLIPFFFFTNIASGAGGCQTNRQVSALYELCLLSQSTVILVNPELTQISLLCSETTQT